MSERNDDEQELDPLDDEEPDHTSDQEANSDLPTSDPDALHTEIIEANSDEAPAVADDPIRAADDAAATSETDESDELADNEEEGPAITANEDDQNLVDSDTETEILNFRTEALVDEDDVDSHEADFDHEDEADFDDQDELAVRRTSWWKVVGGLAAACAVFAMVAWGLGLSVTGDEASDADLAAQLPDAENAPAQQKGEASSKKRKAQDADTSTTDEPADDSADSKKEQVKTEKQGKPPKVAIQIFDTKQGLCPDFFELSINVFVVKGQVDRGMARLTIPAEGKIRSYPLYEVQGDFSNVLRGIPTSMTAKLYIRVEGPDGVTEEWHDVTHTCPGKKVDDVEKTPKQLKKEKKFTFKVPKMKDLFDEEALDALEDLGLGNKDKDKDDADTSDTEKSDSDNKSND